MIFGDSEPVEEDIEKRIDENLIYVIFYDRESKPFAANDFIKNYYDIYADSNLDPEVKKGEYFLEIKNILTAERSGRYLRIMEIEVPIYVEDHRQIGDRSRSDYRWRKCGPRNLKRVRC